jgi:superfamily II DNA or RNA helicase
MLDEGVDIPSVDHCILIASSESKRQYIQRRGRVLRVNKQSPKGVAEIWDLIVVDENNVAFTPAEIVRATEFARMAINHSINIDLEKLIP